MDVVSLNDHEMALVHLSKAAEEYSHVIGSEAPSMEMAKLQVRDLLSSTVALIRPDAAILMSLSFLLICLVSRIMSGIISDRIKKRNIRHRTIFRVIRNTCYWMSNYRSVSPMRRYLLLFLSLGQFFVIISYLKNLLHTDLVGYENQPLIDTLDQLAKVSLRPVFAPHSNLAQIMAGSSNKAYQQLWSKCKDGCTFDTGIEPTLAANRVKSREVATLFPENYHIIMERIYCGMFTDDGNNYYKSKVRFEKSFKFWLFSKHMKQDVRRRFDRV
ncbi:hypothetical protein HDE_13001 [Halotydeus destructor]|nr:hypothetical protein HDE_13001 [Halotydeus destructor]